MGSLPKAVGGTLTAVAALAGLDGNYLSVLMSEIYSQRGWGACRIVLAYLGIVAAFGVSVDSRCSAIGARCRRVAAVGDANFGPRQSIQVQRGALATEALRPSLFGQEESNSGLSTLLPRYAHISTGCNLELSVP
jgi:hypothetical protein